MVPTAFSAAGAIYFEIGDQPAEGLAHLSLHQRGAQQTQERPARDGDGQQHHPLVQALALAHETSAAPVLREMLERETDGKTLRMVAWAHAELTRPDRFAEIKADYVKHGPGRSNLRYGWVRNTV